MKLNIKIVIALLLCVANSKIIFGKDFYVSVNGDDKNTGSFEKPFKSLEGARNAIRFLRNKGEVNEDIAVYFREGIYIFRRSVEFDIRDSGDEHKVLFSNYENEKVEFVGARELFFEKKDMKLWQTHIAASSGEPSYFEQLFVNNGNVYRAKSPNGDELYRVDKVVQKVINQGNSRIPLSANISIFHDESLFSEKDSIKAHEPPLIVLFHKWDNTKRYLTEGKIESGELLFQGKGMKPWNKFDDHSRFYVENFFSALDSPGEWFLSQDNVLYYIPRKEDLNGGSKFYIPTTDKLIYIKGDCKSKRLVQNITFEGIEFKMTGYKMPDTGNDPFQAAANIDAVVTVDCAENILFNRCLFSKLSLGALWFRTSVVKSEVKNCLFENIGATAVKIGNISVTNTNDPGNIISNKNIISNNIIRNVGELFPSATGISIFHSSDNIIQKNEISNLKYTGISVGWVWGYKDSKARGNKVIGNYIHNINGKYLSDLGGVYTLGTSEGTVISNNVIHDVESREYGGWGLYADEGSSYITFKNNIVYNCFAGFHQHYGKENIVENNIFALNKKYQLKITRIEPHNSLTFKSNIIYSNGVDFFEGNWSKAKIKSDNNLYWDTIESNLLFGDDDFENWKSKGRDTNSLVEYIKVSYNEEKFLKINNKRLLNKIGFKTIDTRNIGVDSSNKWKTN
ncbi:right-handed parallel beta-helix repeat-containing protein [Echinicola sp. CAU 1574]|uniref:Right-handed parallel beta-helix repeat-containing protein n=1 Tax=Echinicola arenosa TaxID=2774144 RepID=A0ABR9AMP3_9BACT|nr:right-handed parallel beta-helix repeat-containing protein [Echinicola arenosa]MBD8490080.1 right-handed parallel beta-helix repeat-containing protein [Echinicola arenosa]